MPLAGCSGVLDLSFLSEYVLDTLSFDSEHLSTVTFESWSDSCCSISLFVLFTFDCYMRRNSFTY